MLCSTLQLSRNVEPGFKNFSESPGISARASALTTGELNSKQNKNNKKNGIICHANITKSQLFFVGIILPTTIFFSAAHVLTADVNFYTYLTLFFGVLNRKIEYIGLDKQCQPT